MKLCHDRNESWVCVGRSVLSTCTNAWFYSFESDLRWSVCGCSSMRGPVMCWPPIFNKHKTIKNTFHRCSQPRLYFKQPRCLAKQNWWLLFATCEPSFAASYLPLPADWLLQRGGDDWSAVSVIVQYFFIFYICFQVQYWVYVGFMLLQTYCCSSRNKIVLNKWQEGEHRQKDENGWVRVPINYYGRTEA